jgi:hypothetical protein
MAVSAGAITLAVILWREDAEHARERESTSAEHPDARAR